MAEVTTVPIPSPPGLPIIGNVTNIDLQSPLASFVKLADQYGEIFRVHFPGRSVVFICTNALVNEVCDEKRFSKSLGAILKVLRKGVNNGLFTAEAEEPNWGIAHRVLMPAFGPMSIQGMFDGMHDIASQLAMKWARHGSGMPIMVTDDFTRLTLDTLALCSMDYRFNSYYHDELHPFIQAMGDFLIESGARAMRPSFLTAFYRQVEQKYEEDISLLRRTAEDVLRSRKEHPTEKKDLLNAMLNGADPKTGQKMSDQSIIDNLITFLIAGHETTSGLLSFAFYHLIKNPNAYQRAQREVDEIIGTEPITVKHMSKLPYISAVLRETLRLCATVPFIAARALKDEIIGGKYLVRKEETISLLLAKAHLDPVVYGETANEFIPERMLDENFERLTREFPNSWKPFGNGMRACIGRPFAWQEAVLVMAMSLQNFNFVMDDPSYHLSIKQTLTIKPKDFYMRAILRNGLTASQLEHRLAGTTAPPPNMCNSSHQRAPKAQETQHTTVGKPLSIYYGSNSGTCEALAQQLASDAPAHGFSAASVEPLDAAKENLPRDQPIAIITASYEGEPPDNAALFCAWIRDLKGKEMDSMSYAVFGCGHHDWTQTFHRVPRLIDSTLEELGGNRLAPLGLTDAADGRMFTDFETWEEEVFWPAVRDRYGILDSRGSEASQTNLSVEISAPRVSTLRQDVKEATVVATQELTAPDAPTKRHMEIKLPSGLEYSVGDYLAVLPFNPEESVRRALRRFQIPWDAHITIAAAGHTSLPTGISVAANDVLGAYVELSQPATKRSILALVEAGQDEATKEILRHLAIEAYTEEITTRHVSVLDLLERFPSVSLPFGTFLSLLPPMRVRQYSVSSSPLWNASHVTLTYSVLDAPALSGTGRHIGVASSYLSSLATGDKLHVSIRPSHGAFHLPVDCENIPIIMVAAGSGIAPFRGFVQERAAMIATGRKLAPALLFFGCRNPSQDDLYRDEMDRWQAMGVIDVRRAYSRMPEASHGCVHVQDRLWNERNDVAKLWKDGAKVFVCGSRAAGESVKRTAIKIYKWMAEQDGNQMGEEDAENAFESIRNVRYATDVFD